MMDLINKIYNSEYFIIGLLIVIAILAIVFIALIFSGRKKKKKSDQPDNNELEKNLETISNIVEGDPSIPSQNVLGSVTSENVVENTPVVEANSLDSESSPNVDQPNTMNDDIYNTSIFHGAPIDLVNEPTPAVSEPVTVDTAVIQPTTEDVDNISVGTPAVEQKESIVNNLFEPVPDFGDFAVNNSIIEEQKPVAEPIANPSFEQPNIFSAPTFVTPAVEMPNITSNVNDNSASDIKPVSVSEDVKIESVPKQEEAKIQMPTQFSSVHINKEEPKAEVKANDSKPYIPPYDPTLFSSIAKPAPKQPTQVEAPASAVANFESTKAILDSLLAMDGNSNSDVSSPVEPINPAQPAESYESEFTQIKAVPALEPMNEDNFSETTEFHVNPENTFGYTATSNNTSNNNQNNFPSFEPESFNINNQ